MKRLALAAFGLAAACGCAPIGPYRGAAPAPGALLSFADGGAPPRADSLARAGIVPGTADRAGHRLGDLARADGGGPFVVLLFGDNRPGYRMEANSPAFYPVKHILRDGAGGFFRGLLWTPVFLVNAFLPTLDGPRDLVTAFTKRPGGGGEKKVIAALERALPADLVVNTGDLVFDGRRGLLWEDWWPRVRTLRERAPFVVAPGNHERLYDAGAAAAWDATVAPSPEPGRRWCALDVPGADARLVFLDSNLLTGSDDNPGVAPDPALADAQLAWADEALSGPQRVKLVLLHHPPVSSGHYLGDWGGDDESSPSARRRLRLLEICGARGVTAVLCGHEHLYQRVRVASGANGGFWQVTSAGGGAPLYPIDRARQDRAYSRPLPAGLAVDRASAKTERTYHFCRIELPEGGNGAVRLVAMRPDGAPFDTLDLARGPAR